MGQKAVKRAKTQSYSNEQMAPLNGSSSASPGSFYFSSLKHKTRNIGLRRSNSLTRKNDDRRGSLSATSFPNAFEPDLADSVFIEEDEDMGSKEFDEAFEDEIVAVTDPQKMSIKYCMAVMRSNRELIAFKGIQKMFEKMPHVITRFSHSQNRPIRFGHSWELMGQGITFYNALDCCAHRIGHHFAMRAYLARLTKIHVSYGVKFDEMATALEAFHEVIAGYLASRNPPADEGALKSVDHFFRLIGQVLAQAYDTTTIAMIEEDFQQ